VKIAKPVFSGSDAPRQFVGLTESRKIAGVVGHKQLGRQDVVGLLQQTLEEERAADQKLTSMAEAKVNRKAA
jgi:hypothetical protein